MLFCMRVINMTIYEKIRQLRINAGMSQDDLAKAMGYKDRSMITKIESGKVDISQKKILAFSRIFNIAPSVLLVPSEDIPPVDPQIRIVSGMMEKMTKEQQDQVVNVIRAMFANHPELLK